MPPPKLFSARMGTAQLYWPLGQCAPAVSVILDGPITVSQNFSIAALPLCPKPVGSKGETPTGSWSVASSRYRASHASLFLLMANSIECLLASTAKCWEVSDTVKPLLECDYKRIDSNKLRKAAREGIVACGSFGRKHELSGVIHQRFQAGR